jgi:type I restriction enzyme S subunit
VTSPPTGRKQHPDIVPANELLKKILIERRQKWEEAELAKMRAKGKAPKNEKWKARYKEPEPVDTAGLPELPTGWCWAKLPMCGEVARGKSKHRPRNDPRLYGEKYPFIQTGEVARANGRITKSKKFYSDFGLAQSRLFPAGTVCITIAANIADTAVLAIDSCFPDSVVGVIVEKELLTPSYLEAYIRTIRDDLAAFAPATAQKNINLAILNEVVVPIPPKAEMLKIDQQIQKVMTVIDRIEKRLAISSVKLITLERSILAKAFRGELVPQDPNEEPAAIILERIRAERQATKPGKKTGKKK